jgi:hypothetical protein
MKTTFISLIALGVAAAMAGPADRAQADEPMVLSDAELDRVAAGLLLPAVQAAREAARRNNAGVAPVMEAVEGQNLILSTTVFETGTPLHPRLGLRNLAREVFD